MRYILGWEGMGDGGGRISMGVLYQLLGEHASTGCLCFGLRFLSCLSLCLLTSFASWYVYGGLRGEDWCCSVVWNMEFEKLKERNSSVGQMSGKRLHWGNV